jgi:prevent-host-death family protein
MGKKISNQYNMYEAKTKLSEIVKRVSEGENVILMNRGKPVAEVIPFENKKTKRKLGFAKDIELLEDFDGIPEGFEDYA